MLEYLEGVGQEAEGVGQEAEGVGQEAEGVGQEAEGVGQVAEGVGQEAEGQGRVSIACILGRARNLIGSPDSPVSIGEALLKLW